MKLHRLFLMLVAFILAACAALEAGVKPTPVEIATALPSLAPAMSSTSLPVTDATSTIASDSIPTPTAAPTTPACTVRSDWMTYTVQAGDTLSQLAAETNTSVEDLTQANCLLSTGISVGQELHVPMLPAPPFPTATPTGVINADCWRDFQLSAWIDLDGDGLWSTSEPPLAGVKFEVRGIFMEMWGYPYLSNADGRLTIETLTPGRCDGNDWTITAIPPESYEPTTPTSVTFTFAGSFHEAWQCGFRAVSK